LIRQKYSAGKYPQAKPFWAGVTICCLCLLVLNPLWASYLIMQRQPAISHFAAQWDTANRLILDGRSQGLAQVTVPRIDNWDGLEDLSLDSNFWVNRCANIYYGITIQTE
jgi:hypothetical protein